jgi:uncharacterized protein (DUF4415 family)
MSTAWIAHQLITNPIERLMQPPPEVPRFNPRPRGQIQPGSAAEAVLQLMRDQPHRWFRRHQVINITARTRKAVDWALIYLEALGHIEAKESDQDPHVGNHSFRLTPQKRGRGRPRLPEGQRRAKVPMRIREDLLDKLLELGPGWLDQAVAAAPAEVAVTV